MRILMITLALCLYPFAVFAVDLEKAVKMLEAAGDFETAEPIAFKLAQQKKEHYYRIAFLNQYPTSEFAEIVYMQTWQDVQNSGNMAKLQSFVKVMPRGRFSLDALDKLFALYQKEDTILGYQNYIKEFPNSPQAVKALQEIFRLAFQRATKHADKLNSVKFFDEYIRTFPTSPYLEKVNQKAEEMEYQAVNETLDTFTLKKVFSSKQEQKETVARKMYNEMRFWQGKNQLLISQRKYNLLQKNIFIDTVAYTEMMDREETLEFRKAVVSFQKQTTQKLDDLNRLYQEESKRIINTIRHQAQLTRKSITEQGLKTRNDIRYMASKISDLSYERGRLADAVNEQTDRMAAEAQRASYEQRQMLERAGEQSRRQAERSRHCAEVLSKHGKYPFMSGCP